MIILMEIIFFFGLSFHKIKKSISAFDSSSRKKKRIRLDDIIAEGITQFEDVVKCRRLKQIENISDPIPDRNIFGDFCYRRLLK